jgi:hypothetical protein
VADLDTQYVLSFDVQELTRQMAELQAAYSVFTSGVQQTSRDINTSLTDIENKVVNISSALDSSYSKLDTFYTSFLSRLETSSQLFSEIDSNAKSLHNQLKVLGDFNLKSNGSNVPAGAAAGGQGFNFSISGGAQNVEELQKSLATAEAVSRAAKKAIEESKKAEKSWKDSAKKIGGYLVKELKTAKSKISGMLSGFSGGALGTGFLGMGALALISSMVMGVQERQRKGAQRGEMANAYEAAGNLFEKTSQQAVKWASNFQEKAQYHYGIGRKEIQSVMEAIVKGGHAAELSMSDFNKSVSDVNANILTQSLALDKAFNQAAGTTIKQADKLVQEFGGTIGGAVEQLKMLNYEAQRSGMSMDKFVNSILSGQSSLMQYRVDMSEVASVMKGLKKTYEDMGMGEAQAGALSAKVTEGMGGVFGGMSESQKQAFAIYYFKKKQGKDYSTKGHEALVRMEELFLQGGGESSGALLSLIEWLNTDATAGAKSVYDRKHILKGGYGLSSLQAQGIVDYYNANRTPEGLAPMTPEQEKQWKQTFNIEGSQLTQLQKNQRDLIDGLAKVGEGLLNLVSNILATLILGIRSIPPLVHAAVTALDPTASKEDRNAAFGNIDKIGQTQSTFFEGMSDAVSKIIEGYKNVASALGDTISIIDQLGSIKRAATADVGSVNWTSMWNTVKDTKEAVDNLMSSQTERDMLMRSLTDRVEFLADVVLNKTGVLSDSAVKAREQQRQKATDVAYDSAKRWEGPTMKGSVSKDSLSKKVKKGVTAVINAGDLDKSDMIRNQRRVGRTP